MGFIVVGVVVLFVPVCIILVLTILLQDSKGGGLSSAFGASEVQSVLGGRGAATFLTKLTTWVAVGFMVMSLFLMRFYGDVKTGELTPIETQASQSEVLSPGEESKGDTTEGEAAEGTQTNTTEGEASESTDEVNDSEDVGK